MSGRVRPGHLRKLYRVGAVQSALRSEQQKTADLERYVEQLQARLTHSQGSVEDCRRDHTGLAQRNGLLQQMNCSLADQLGKAQDAAGAAGDEMLAAIHREGLLKILLRDLVGHLGAEHEEVCCDGLIRQAAELLTEAP